MGFTLDLSTLGNDKAIFRVLGRCLCPKGTTPLFKMIVDQKAQGVPVSGMAPQDLVSMGVAVPHSSITLVPLE